MRPEGNAENEALAAPAAAAAAAGGTRRETPERQTFGETQRNETPVLQSHFGAAAPKSRHKQPPMKERQHLTRQTQIAYHTKLHLDRHGPLRSGKIIGALPEKAQRQETPVGGIAGEGGQLAAANGGRSKTQVRKRHGTRAGTYEASSGSRNTACDSCHSFPAELRTATRIQVVQWSRRRLRQGGHRS